MVDAPDGSSTPCSYANGAVVCCFCHVGFVSVDEVVEPVCNTADFHFHRHSDHGVLESGSTYVSAGIRRDCKRFVLIDFDGICCGEVVGWFRKHNRDEPFYDGVDINIPDAPAQEIASDMIEVPVSDVVNARRERGIQRNTHLRHCVRLPRQDELTITYLESTR